MNEISPESLAHQWNQLWDFEPSYHGMFKEAETKRYYPHERVTSSSQEAADLALAQCKEVWKSLMFNTKQQPRAQVIIFYKIIFNENVIEDTNTQLAIGKLEQIFKPAFWNSELYGKRFAQESIGIIHWHYSAGNFNWKVLAPLIALTIDRHPINNQGGIIVATADLTRLWHPYEGGYLTLMKD